MGFVGHAQLRQGAADANDGYRPRRVAIALPQRAHRNGVRKVMSPSREIIKRGRKAAVASSGAAGLLPERELRAIIDNVLRLAESTEADETEVHVDEVDDSLTRFANNAI